MRCNDGRRMSNLTLSMGRAACSLSPAKPSYSGGGASVCDGAHQLKLRTRLPLRSRMDRARGCNDALVVIAGADRWAVFSQRTPVGEPFGESGGLIGCHCT